MMMLLRMIVRQIANRPLRALLTFCSITLGVASVVAVQITVATARQGYEGLTEAGTGTVALEVVSEERPFDVALAERVRQVPGVTAAVPVLQHYSTMRTRGRAVTLALQGLDLSDPNSLADYDLRSGRQIQGPREVLLEISLARALDIQLGEEVKFLTRSRPLLKDCTVVGMLAPRSVGAMQGGFAFAPLEEVQSWFEAPGQCNHIQVQVGRHANVDEVRTRLNEMLPHGLHARVPVARSQLSSGTIKPTIQALSFCSALAFVMAAFIILNSFLMTVSERRRLLSTMRALGTTRRQIILLLLSEGLVLGTLGTVVGCFLGLGAARLLRTALEELVWGTLPPLQLTWQPFILAALLGLGVSLLGAYLPARQASRVSPLEGIRGPLPDEKPHAMRWYLAGGLLLGVLAGVVLTGCIQAWLPITLAAPAGTLAIVAAVLLLPPLLPALERVVGGIVTPLLRFEGRLAHLTILRYQVRSALTVGVLFVALCTGFAMGNTVFNNVRDVQHWGQQTFRCDVMIRAYRPGSGSETTPDIPLSLEQQVRQLPGIASVDTLRLVRIQVDGEEANLVVRQFPDPKDLQLEIQSGKPDEIYHGLKNGAAVLSTRLAQDLKKGAGDTVVVETSTTQRSLPVVGVCTDYMLGGTSLYLERGQAKSLLGIDGSDGLLVRLEQPGDSETLERLRTLTNENGLLMQSYSDFMGLIDQMMNGANAMIWGVLILDFLVAGLAIANTLSMNVLEQTRELGLMRAGGMTRNQVQRLVVFQALLMALVGLPLGAAAGLLLAWVISLCLLPLIGHPVPFDLRLPLLAACSATALLIVLAASWLPARRAARTPAIETIHTE